MSKNYDNWERLVGAVLRRESDRQLAYTDSINSVSSLDLSFNSTARFDDDDFGIGMSKKVWEKLARVLLQRECEMQIAQTISPLLERIQYSDLQNLNHNDWWTMLLPHQQLVWRSASLVSFFSDTSEWTGPNNCFLVGSKNIEDFNFKHREFTSNTKSRFPEVLEINDLEDLDVGFRIKTRMLSQNTLYAAYLVFALTQEYATLVEEYAGINHHPLAASSTLKILPFSKSFFHPKDQNRTLIFEQGNGRSDGWMEVELGDFYVYYGEEDREVQAQLSCYDEVIMNMRRVGLIIEGFEFRPSNANGLLFSKFNHSDDDDDDDDDPLSTPTPTEKGQLLPAMLRKWTRTNSLMLGARELLISWEDNSSCWKWTTHDHSRFPEVVELTNVWWLKIRGRINTRMLPPKTGYVAFLVFNLADGCRGLEQARGMVRFLDESSENDAEKGARDLNLLDAVSRADRWMEIEMGNFYVDQGNEREVEAQLFEFRCNLKSGLIIEGIEFRPV